MLLIWLQQYVNVVCTNRVHYRHDNRTLYCHEKQLFPLQSAYIPGQMHVNCMQAQRLNSIDVFNTGVIRECFVNLEIPSVFTLSVILPLSFTWKQIKSFIKTFVLKVWA